MRLYRCRTCRRRAVTSRYIRLCVSCRWSLNRALAASALLLLAACTAPRSASTVSPPSAQTGAPRSQAEHGVPPESPAVAGRLHSGNGKHVGSSPEGSVASDPSPVGALGTAADVTIEGIASWVAPRYGRDYLAMRLPRGTRVTLSGPGGTWDAVVNDYGPARRTGRIADIAVGQWERICAVPRSLGLCRVTAVITKRGASPTLPATDAQ